MTLTNDAIKNDEEGIEEFSSRVTQTMTNFSSTEIDKISCQKKWLKKTKY